MICRIWPLLPLLLRAPLLWRPPSLLLLTLLLRPPLLWQPPSLGQILLPRRRRSFTLGRRVLRSRALPSPGTLNRRSPPRGTALQRRTSSPAWRSLMRVWSRRTWPWWAISSMTSGTSRTRWASHTLWAGGGTPRAAGIHARRGTTRVHTRWGGRQTAQEAPLVVVAAGPDLIESIEGDHQRSVVGPHPHHPQTSPCSQSQYLILAVRKVLQEEENNFGTRESPCYHENARKQENFGFSKRF